MADPNCLDCQDTGFIVENYESRPCDRCPKKVLHMDEISLNSFVGQARALLTQFYEQTRKDMERVGTVTYTREEWFTAFAEWRASRESQAKMQHDHG